jgi:pimeloyl-ACP methyl ester carboxylesterase
MQTVTSRDGTPIAYVRAGDGTPLIIVTGVFNDHTTLAELADLLATDHTIVRYDRRGRGASGDTQPYDIAREIDDLAALLDVVGGSAALFGFSSGAVLGLRAVADGVPITHLVMYEAPFDDDPEHRPADRPQRLADLIAQGEPGAAVALFQREHIGLPPEMVEHARQSPMWPALEAFARSMVYDATITTTLARPTPDMLAVTTPTLLLNGVETWPGLREANIRLAKSLPAARHQELAGGAMHTPPAALTAEAVRAFLHKG